MKLGAFAFPYIIFIANPLGSLACQIFVALFQFLVAPLVPLVSPLATPYHPLRALYHALFGANLLPTSLCLVYCSIGKIILPLVRARQRD